MLVVIPFCARDKAQAVRLAEHIAELGGVGKHDCLLAVHKDTDSEGVIEPLTSAFGRIAEFAITDDMIVEREQHTYAANLMWKRTVNHIAEMNESQPWLWMEVDAAPTKASWLDAIHAAYAACGKPFLHDLVKTPRGKSNSGCGVYPAKVRDHTSRLWELSDVSWDILLYEDFAPHTAYTPLIQDVGFLKDGMTLPTFPDQASLSIIRPEAVIFHRCKDGTLIDRLSGKSETASTPVPAGDRSLTESASPVEPSLGVVALKRIIDMRGYDAERMPALKLAADAQPTRLESLAIGTPQWNVAQYELRHVEESSIPGITIGDFVIFSRVAPAADFGKSGRSESTAINVEGRGSVWCEKKVNRIVEHTVSPRKPKAKRHVSPERRKQLTANLAKARAAKAAKSTA